MDIKHSATILEQIKKLTDRGLEFKDIEFARTILLTIGYYPVINAYKSPFLKSGEQFKPHTSFEDIYNLYDFDRHQRRIIQTTLESIELTLREISCRAFLNEYGDSPDAYTKIENYRNIPNNWDRNKFLNNMRRPKNKLNDVDPFKHYLEKYDGIPLWVAMTSWDLGNLLHFISYQKTRVKLTIAKEFFNNDFLSDEDTKLLEFQGNTFELLRKLRNRAAHGNRLYNYKPMTKNSDDSLRPIIQFTPDFHFRLGINENDYSHGYGQGDVYTLILITHLLRYSEPKKLLIDETLDNLISHLKYHRDLDYYLLDSLGFTDSQKSNFVKLNIDRNTLLNAANKLNNIYSYEPVISKNAIYIDPADLRSGLFNSSPF